MSGWVGDKDGATKWGVGKVLFTLNSQLLDIKGEEVFGGFVGGGVEEGAGASGEVGDDGAVIREQARAMLGEVRRGEVLGLAFGAGVGGAVEEGLEELGVDVIFLHRLLFLFPVCPPLCRSGTDGRQSDGQSGEGVRKGPGWQGYLLGNVR